MLLFGGWLELPTDGATGSMLTCCSPRMDYVEAFLAPGSLVLGPAEAGEEFSEQGWRRVQWSAETWSRGHDYTQAVPDLLETLKLLDLGRALQQRVLTEPFTDWLEHSVRGRFTALSVLLHHCEGVSAEQLSGFLAELDELKMDAVELFGSSWLEQELLGLD